MPFNTTTVRGTYGSGRTPCLVYVLRRAHGAWYAVDGSRNVNFTPADDRLEHGVNVEELPDSDYFYAREPIESEDDLERECDD